MFDLRIFIDTKELENLKENLKKRNFKDLYLLDKIHLLAKERNDLLKELNLFREERNSISKSVGREKSNKQNKQDFSEQFQKVKEISKKIKELDIVFKNKEEQIQQINLSFPNKIDSKVPIGENEKQNVLQYEKGEKRKFDFEPLSHYELGIKRGWIDFEKGTKLAGARFYTYLNQGARLERALVNFMLDTNTKENNYQEVWVPVLVNDESMTVTGQYPKFKDEYFRIERDKLNLIPTSEVPLVNLYRDNILPVEQLPICLTAQTSCFRREAGSYGKDTRGLLRVHQFQKVELVKITTQEESEKEHQAMIRDIEIILQKLELPYRLILLCSGDMSAASSITYDFEIWMPSLNDYFEISSVSNMKEYQARRGKIRYKTKKDEKYFAHTLNGSALAIGRTLAAIIENYQTKSGDISIPSVLKNYL